MLRRLRRSIAALVVGVSLAFAWEPAFAEDFADEAELQFRLGAERYGAGEYRSALEHFLASNRLVRNRNAVFNIARTYEKLERYPEAFRYYAGALAEETEEAARQRIEEALALLRPRVAILDVSTEPSGATLYVDRKDLGPRGESPRALGLLPGRYKVIAELPGHYPAEAVVEGAKLGATVPVKLVLRPILGVLTVDGTPPGGTVRIDDPNGPPRCRVPCRLELPPGRYALRVSLPGHRSVDATAEIAARVTSTVRVGLEPETGGLLVSTDEPGTLVEVDGRARGFTPVVLTLPIGVHRVRLSRKGFQTVDRSVVVLTGRQEKLEETLAQSEEVEAASRVTESASDAPSSVTLVPRDEIVAFGYPTIAEAVRGVRGIYLWNDRSYVSLGVRGLGRLGSYSNRELVLYDGHPANDDWIGSAYVGFDAKTDLGDVERIEVVRGPGSVLYGTNAFSGVINVVSRGEGERPRGEVGVSAVEANVARGRVRAETRLGPEAGVWASISGAHGGGRDFYFPELATGTSESGQSRGADRFEAGSTQGRAHWKWITAQWFLHSHDKELPTGIYETLLDDPRTHQADTRAFVEVRAEPKLFDAVQLFTRAHWNHYRFRGDYARPPGGDTDGVEFDTFDGSWAGLEQRVVLALEESFRLTLGGEGQVHYQVDATGRTESGYFLEERGEAGRDYQVGALYALADATLSEGVRLSGGVRVDAYSTFGYSLNPRLAAVLRPYDGGNLKILAGKAFRAPSIYELYYNDGGETQVASPDLEPESLYSLEVEHSHRFSPVVTGLVSVYGTYVKDLIDALGSGEVGDEIHYENSPSPLLSLGAEIGLRREWRQGFMLEGTYGLQHSTFLATTSASALFGVEADPSKRHVANSPNHLASIKGAVPILARGLTAATRLTLEGVRYDRYESVTDPPQGRTGAAVIWDVVLSGREERWGLGYSFGAYNVADWRYSLPVSGEFVQTRILQNGRTFLASADVAF